MVQYLNNRLQYYPHYCYNISSNSLKMPVLPAQITPIAAHGCLCTGDQAIQCISQGQLRVENQLDRVPDWPGPPPSPVGVGAARGPCPGEGELFGEAAMMSERAECPPPLLAKQRCRHRRRCVGGGGVVVVGGGEREKGGRKGLVMGRRRRLEE